MRRGWTVLLAVTLVLVLPELAHACPVCFDSSAENRIAFARTALVLTLLPLGLVGGTGLWLRRRARRMEEDGEPGAES